MATRSFCSQNPLYLRASHSTNYRLQSTQLKYLPMFNIKPASVLYFRMAGNHLGLELLEPRKSQKELLRSMLASSYKGLLVGVKKSSTASDGWGDNPKNTLVTSVAFRDVCCGGNARALPITLRSSGPDHAKTFVAELTVPLRNKGEVFVAVGQGPNKAEAERACCTAACAKLYDVGLLQKPNDKGYSPPFTAVPASNKAAHNQQQNEMPAIVSLRIEELSMMEDALQRLHFENVRLEKQEPEASVSLQPRSFAHKSNDIPIPKEQLGTENAILRLEARKRSVSPEFAEQRRVRQSLPAWRERQKIVGFVSNHRVVVLTGETGCGKTTQVPQYVLEDAELQGSGAEVHIVVTQPRRIAAISVAERVAWERGETLGKSVGYAIRLESSPPRPRGSILYCTTGILLHRLQRADGLVGVSHVIIDEVHERDVDTDFLLVVIRELLNHSPTLRVVVMSATLDASIFTRYFGGCPLVNIPGMTHPVRVYNLDDLPQLMGRFHLPALRQAHGGSLDEEDVDIDLTVSVIVWISQVFAQGDGAILCFLPGWDTITIVRDRLLKVRASRFMMIVPLHSQLPAGEQRAAFARAPFGMRKVVLATNIAETSVTIDDVVYVVDSGKIKEKQYDVSRNLTTMRVQWTSQASARQRQGRAGRVQPGFCFQLFTQTTFLNMLEHQIPEMQRVPLEELCLQIKAVLSPNTVVEKFEATGVNFSQELEETRAETTRIATFLSKAIQPPTASSVYAAIQVLKQLGAVDEFENLTPLGRILAKLTVHPRFGKMLVYGALLGCLDPLLTVAAAACFRDPFVSPLNRREEADQVRASFGTGVAYGSDQLALVNAFQQWKAADFNNHGYSFCEDNFLAFMTMTLIAGMRTQFERTLLESGLCEPYVQSPNPVVSAHLARSLLVAGLYPNIVRSELCRESKGMKNATKHAYRWRLGFCGVNGRVFLHPTSVLSEKHLNSSLSYYLVFQEKLQTSQVFIRGCTLLPPLAVVLLGWNVTFIKDVSSGSAPSPNGDWMLLRVEGWLNFFIDRRAGLLLLQLRDAFDVVLARWVSGHARTDSERQVVECVVTLLESTCYEMLETTSNRKAPIVSR
ncbi:uncharacterized protein [Physcomitrium patens]|uniref:RNA helicase n=2 Tax=Physcomitrium patens TaxID=3218 RepID=A0A2K1K7T8_PHYPA|nr:ATP-dependent RNA helicase DHX36-like isoform X2 [Physcomitrium patens]PNR49837.1 hypothetical protein PHYPA_011733 [Physcomitrium patens]|eukprot:XP_024382865.1 ATP-dependent RNA helicase DHX36-like isoform X2 [Physcomitrella patens]